MELSCPSPHPSLPLVPKETNHPGEFQTQNEKANFIAVLPVTAPPYDCIHSHLISKTWRPGEVTTQINPKQPKEFVSLWLLCFPTTHFNLTEAVSNLQQLLVVIVRRQPAGVFGPDIKQGGGTVRIVKENNFRVGGQPQLISERPCKTCLVLSLSKGSVRFKHWFMVLKLTLL